MPAGPARSNIVAARAPPNCTERMPPSTMPTAPPFPGVDQRRSAEARPSAAVVAGDEVPMANAVPGARGVDTLDANTC
jgi:hypothetical protein